MTLRAVILGLCCVVFIAAFAPYNDYALYNTTFIGSHLPVGITLLMLLLILGLNPVIRRLRPAAALRPGELITVWAMCLVGAAFPTLGLMRLLVPWLIGPIYQLPQNPEWQQVLSGFPEWLFPSTDPDDPVVTRFFLGTELGDPLVVPWSAWVEPMARWGLFVVPLYLGILLLTILMSRQWIVHEKLPYPIATVMLEMVREAPPGRRLNALFGDRRMWLGAGIVVVIHLINGLHSYFPKVPAIPIGFDMRPVFTEGFWPHLLLYVKIASIYFSMVGIAFLMASESALSLWLVIVVYCTLFGIFGYHGIGTYEAMRSQQYGAILAMGVFVLFLARSHLWRAHRAAIMPHHRTDRDYAGYRWVVLGLYGCVAACVVWLWTTGIPAPVAIVQVVVLYLVHLVMSRLVAETGLYYVTPRAMPGTWLSFWPDLVTNKIRNLITVSFYPVQRTGETLMPFAFHALRLNHEATGGDRPDAEGPRPVAPSFFGALVTAGGLSLLVAGVVSIAVYYSEGAIRTNNFITTHELPANYAGMARLSRDVPPLPDQRLGQAAFGAALVVLFGLLRLRFASWPFVPIALCMATSGALAQMWLSILIGWLCKVAVMRTGGVEVYNRVRPFFLGLVVGEIVMAGVWMIVGMVVRLCGSTHKSYMVLPDFMNI